MTCWQYPDCNCRGACEVAEAMEQAVAERLRQRAAEDAPTFQARATQWVQTCFGGISAYSKIERSHRFLEEALELAQATGTTRDQALELVAYVYDRPIGETAQEAGGTMLTLAALCSAHRIHLPHAAEAELQRVWLDLPRIRAKQAAAVPGSALPGRTDQGGA